ncbi:MAG TPA: hypothetical protein VHY19_02445 [Steroidobacteraceae bacterium]|jgi:ElaB/YqjD/DUF883 family membrane-anchored ribosome-binding protein|nr:hypothetical protein [Steroidobacteraceae bacterium]
MTEDTAGTGPYNPLVSDVVARPAGKLKAQFAAVADKTKETIDSAREPIADKLLGAADTLRARGESFPRGAASVAQGAADKLEASATYLVSKTVPQMMQDVLTLVRKHPAQSLLVAGAMGFFLGRALRRD